MSTEKAPTEDVERLRLRREAGSWLKKLREDAGLSQRDMAAALEIGYYTFISQIESGRGRIPPERYADWADALKVDRHDFVRDILYFYEPTTYRILFTDHSGRTSANDGAAARQKLNNPY